MVTDTENWLFLILEYQDTEQGYPTFRVSDTGRDGETGMHLTPLLESDTGLKG